MPLYPRVPPLSRPLLPPPLRLSLQALPGGGVHCPQYVPQLQRHAQRPGRAQEVLAAGAGGHGDEVGGGVRG